MADEAPDPLAALLAALAKDAKTYRIGSLGALAAFLETRPELLAPSEVEPAEPAVAEERPRRVRQILPKMVTITKPSAGAEFTFTVPATATWQVVSLLARLGTSGSAGNRTVHLTVSDGSTVYARVTANLLQAASLQAFYCWPWNYQAVSSVFGTGAVMTPFPVVPLLGGHVVASVTNGIMVGDQWDTLGMLVLEVREQTREVTEADVSGYTSYLDEHSSYPGIERFVGTA